MLNFILFTFQWLEGDFVEYLDAWRNRVETEKSQLTRTEKNKMLIPNETLSGLYRTGNYNLFPGSTIYNLCFILHVLFLSRQSKLGFKVD